MLSVNFPAHVYLILILTSPFLHMGTKYCSQKHWQEKWCLWSYWKI